MKWISCLVLVICGLALAADRVRAADNTVAFDTGQPTSPAAGKVGGTGSFTEAAGYKCQSITLIASNTAGGPGGQVNCMLNRMTTPQSWSGTIAGLPTGTYTVFARGLFTKPGSPDDFQDTPHVQVTVK